MRMETSEEAKGSDLSGNTLARQLDWKDKLAGLRSIYQTLENVIAAKGDPGKVYCRESWGQYEEGDVLRLVIIKKSVPCAVA